MTPKTVLLDIDGVVFTNRPMLNVVKTKVNKFVQKHVQSRRRNGISEAEAAVLSENMYKSFGHTLKGMWAVYGSQKDFDIDDFNDYVYDSNTLKTLSTYLYYSDDIRLQVENIERIVKKCGDQDIPIGVLSNAPASWCKLICKRYDLEIPPDIFFTSNHPLFHTATQRLKPDRTLYTDIASVVNSEQIVFIDDSIINLAPVTFTKGWVPIQYKYPDDIGAIDINTTQSAASMDTFRKFRELEPYLIIPTI
jgi:FMN phosphatase YigB (HAD superfamily)